jgi:hypothetical protein
MAESEQGDACPEIIVYYPEKKETVWDVAKRYRVPVDSVRRYNTVQNSDINATAVSEGENHILIFNKRPMQM